MEINYIKLYEVATEPFKKYEPDAGWDLTAVWKEETEKYIEYGTGIAFEIPVSYVGLLFPRSSVTNIDLILKNCVGIIDSTYRGEIKLRYAKYHHDLFIETKLKKTIPTAIGPQTVDENIIRSNNITMRKPEYYEIGDRCGQIVFLELPRIKLNLKNKLSETERGNRGYGHTNK